MELSIAQIDLDTLASAVALMSTRPVNATDGIDITGMRVGGYTPVNINGYILRNGADVTVSSANSLVPAPQGIEVWGMKKASDGTARWWLEGVLNSGQSVDVAGAGGVGTAPGGFIFPLELSGIYTRLALVGISSNLTHIPTFFFEPVEHIMQAIS